MIGWRALALGVCLAAPAGAQQGRAGVTVTLLASEGVLIEGGGRRVLIDALFERYGPEYAVPHDSVRGALRRAAAPFDRVDLVLATHWHGDHFHPASVVAHLRANPRARFVAPAQAIDSLRRHGPARALQATRLLPRRLADGGRRRETVAGITLETLGLPHVRGGLLRRRRIEHLGYLLELGGRRVVHLGDAELTPERLAPLRLDTMRIDVALVPFWVLLEEDGRRAIARYVKARQLVAIHLGHDSAEAVRALRRVAPDAVPLVRSLDVGRW